MAASNSGYDPPTIHQPPDRNAASKAAEKRGWANYLLFRALRILRQNPILLVYAILSIAVTAVVFAAMLRASLWGYNRLLDRYLVWIDSWGVWGSALTLLLNITFVVVFLIVAYLTFAQVNSIVCLPFLDLISERVEIIVTGYSESVPFLTGLWTGLTSTIVCMVRKLAILTLCLPLLLIPVIGALAFFLLGAWFLAFDFLDLPMARRGWSFRRKAKFLDGCGKRRLVLGAVLQGTLLVPVVSVLMFPVAAVAATLFFIDVRAAKGWQTDAVSKPEKLIRGPADDSL